jgi:glycosyltransferase involved in cell wall biosynthesis
VSSGKSIEIKSIWQMPKLIIVSEYVLASQNSTGYYWEKIIRRLSEDGHEVGVVCHSENNGNESARVNPSLLVKVLGQLKLTVSLSFRILMEANADTVVFSGTNPALLLFLMPILKWVKGFRWILLAHDVFPDNLIVTGKINFGNIFRKILFWYFNFVYSSANGVICIGRDMRALLAKKVDFENKLHYVSNWVGLNDVEIMDRAKLSLGIEESWADKVVFQFFGNMGPLQGIENILNAILLVESDNAAFVFIGGGSLVHEVQKFISENKLSNVKYLGSLPLSRKSEGLACCDVAFVSLEKGMLGLGVPSKAYFSLAAGKPLMAIVDKESEIGLMIGEDKIGWQCDPDVPNELAEKIDYICENSRLIKEMRPREVFEAKYTGVRSLDEISYIIRLQLSELQTGAV